MKLTTVTVDAFMITELSGLDAIHAMWIDEGPGRGYVTLMCYGSAWTAYFGAMGDRTIRQFFAQAPDDYLAIKMGYTPQLKATKRDITYLTKIVRAVQDALSSIDSSSQGGTK